jgi:hypothetical protein
MIKIAGPEDSGITDRVTGRRVFVTTTVRKAFRAANPSWAKVRNALLNAAIANDFARASVDTKPFPVRMDTEGVGQVRNGSGGQYIAVIYPSGVKIVSIGRAGTPKLTTPAPAPVQMPGQSATSSDEFSFFIVKHAMDGIAERTGISEGRLSTALDLLSERTGLSIDEIVRRIESEGSSADSALVELCSDDGQADYLKTTEDKNRQIVDPAYQMQSSLPSSAFSLQVGLAQS